MKHIIMLILDALILTAVALAVRGNILAMNFVTFWSWPTLIMACLAILCGAKREDDGEPPLYFWGRFSMDILGCFLLAAHAHYFPAAAWLLSAMTIILMNPHQIKPQS